MTVAQYNSSSHSQAYLVPLEVNSGSYNSTLSESSAGSPMNCNSGFDNIYGGNGFMPYTTPPMQYPIHNEGIAPISRTPVKLDIEGLYESHDRKRRNNGSDKVVTSHVQSRRRAQNRASQRAFRDRKETHMRDLEKRLDELEGRYTDLSRTYESLQLEYSSVKQELDRLRNQNHKSESGFSPSTSRSRSCQLDKWEESKREILDPLLFDVSGFRFDLDDGDDEKN